MVCNVFRLKSIFLVMFQIRFDPGYAKALISFVWKYIFGRKGFVDSGNFFLCICAKHSLSFLWGDFEL